VHGLGDEEPAAAREVVALVDDDAVVVAEAAIVGRALAELTDIHGNLFFNGDVYWIKPARKDQQ
jgi:hypothetical protein